MTGFVSGLRSTKGPTPISYNSGHPSALKKVVQMGVYGEQIAGLKLVKEIAKSKGRDDLADSDAIQLHAMVLTVADQVGDLLAAIPMTFKQYTKHDLLHAKNLIDLMGHFIPTKTLKKLNGVELTVLVLVAMLHDFGMYVDEEEKQKIVDGEEFSKLLDAMPEKKQAITDSEASGRPYAASAIRDAVLADYFRKLHPDRARQNIQKYLSGVLRFREYDLIDDVATICSSHGWGVFETTDPRHPERMIEKLKTSDPIYGIPFNSQYVASCLRLADIMDFDRSRTPLALLRTVTDAKSVSEWQKHLQIRGWTITDRDASFHAKCGHPELYVAIMEFLDWIDVELRDCRRLIRKQPKDSAERYMLNLPTSVDRFDVEMADPNYVAGAFKFELDYERIMKILMDKSLYPDPSLFLRELLQNSLDACRVRHAIAKSEQATASYTPRITIWDYSGDTDAPRIIFQDNGVGMSKSVIEKYFMRVGRSYYRSTEFDIERKRLRENGIELEATSQFGIGFLSCFMVADRIEIETYNDRSEPLHILIEGPTKYFTIQVIATTHRPHFRVQGINPEDDGPPVYSGTRIRVHLRSGTKINVREVLDTFAANAEYDLRIISPTADVTIPALRWENQQITTNNAREALTVWPPTIRISESLVKLVVPLLVPIERYPFCDGLRGKLWIWALQDGTGNAVPSLGHLRIGRSLEVVGLPALVSAVRRIYSNLDDVFQAGETPYRGPEKLIIANFNEWWLSSSGDERAMVRRWFDQPIVSRHWTSIEELAPILVSGDFRWAEYASDFGDSPDLEGPDRLALLGIDLPAGITEWDPMAGRGGRIIFPYGAARWIDVRTRVPRPAASRLFLDAGEGARVAVPLLRALLRFALELNAQAPAIWSAWFDSIFQYIEHFPGAGYWWKVIPLERPLLREALHLHVSDGEETHEMTVHECRRSFGRWVPLSKFPDGDPVPSLRRTMRNQMILFGHALRQKGDSTEVDLDTYTGKRLEWD